MGGGATGDSGVLDCRFYNMDCFDGFKMIGDQSVDMILTDPPYGTTNNKWDSVLPLDELWTEYKRIIKPRGAIVLFSQTPFDKVLGESNLEMLKYEWIWEKAIATGFLNARYAPLKAHENILVFSFAGVAPPSGYKSNSPAMVYHPQFTYSKPYKRAVHKRFSANYGKMLDSGSESPDGKRFPRDVLFFAKDTPSLHPTQKPVKLLEYLIKTYTDEGDLVLDSCAGSCSTGVACHNAGRRFIGFEKDEEIFRVGRERLEKETAQTNIFDFNVIQKNMDD